MMIRKKKKSFLRIIFYSSFFSFILIGVLFLIISSYFKTFNRGKEIRQEIKILKEEIQKLEGERLKSFEVFEYLKSDFFKEKEAREKLGLQKAGEKVVVILPANNVVNQTTKEEMENKSEEENLPVFKKWWRYLFK